MAHAIALGFIFFGNLLIAYHAWNGMQAYDKFWRVLATASLVVHSISVAAGMR
jgi:hypothetical protein